MYQGGTVSVAALGGTTLAATGFGGFGLMYAAIAAVFVGLVALRVARIDLNRTER